MYSTIKVDGPINWLNYYSIDGILCTEDYILYCTQPTGYRAV